MQCDGWIWRVLATGLALGLGLGLPAPLLAEEGRLRELATSDDAKGWEAVGRINLGAAGFCTGALIAPDLVLTAAHCLYDKETGARVATDQIEFLADWRNGRAVAYRQVKRAMQHPAYSYSGHDRIDRVPYDLALLELDQPIRLAKIKPFEIAARPAEGDVVGVVSYAQDRSEAPSFQDMCHVLGFRSGVLVLSCTVDFGASGAPVFSVRDGVARIVSVVSAKAELGGENVALSVDLTGALDQLRAAMAGSEGVLHRTALGGGGPGNLGGSDTGGAKFVRP